MIMPQWTTGCTARDDKFPRMLCPVNHAKFKGYQNYGQSHIQNPTEVRWNFLWK